MAGKDAVAGTARVGEYARHLPEQTLLYQLVEAHYPAFVEHLAAHERTLPVHVQREFEAHLKCGRLEHGLLRVRCADCHAERLVAFSWPLLRIPAPAALVIPFPSQATWITPGILPSALRDSLRLFKIAPGNFVCPSCGARRMAGRRRAGR